MSTIIREPYPEAKKLSKSNVAMWTHYMQYKMIDWPDLGSAIQSKHKYVMTPVGLTPPCASTPSTLSISQSSNLLAWNAGPATWTATLTPSLHSK